MTMESATNGFNFTGQPPASKSILNRLLVIQSYHPELVIDGDSDADDVVKMRHSLAQLSRGELADCGSAGTTLRFLALKAARLGGTHHLSGSLRLFSRPQDEIKRVLEQLGCEAQFGPQRITIRSSAGANGWKDPGQPVVIDRSVSSQFASALLLNAWKLPFDLRLRFDGEPVSEGYFQMTVDLMKSLGSVLVKENDEWLIPKGMTINRARVTAELDASSAFPIAAIAAVTHGKATITNWPEKSVQPDAIFPELLKQMGAKVSIENGNLTIVGDKLQGIECDLRSAPDLVPVLGVVCALADGRSRLIGAPHLVHKESNRIDKTLELVRFMGRSVRALNDGLEIEGRSTHGDAKPFKYDTDHDHRLAMAASVARAAGFSVEMTDEKVITKSYPGFYQAISEGLCR